MFMQVQYEEVLYKLKHGIYIENVLYECLAEK